MKLTEIDLIGKPTPSFEQIMHKHNVTKQALQSQLDKSILAIERWHVKSLLTI